MKAGGALNIARSAVYGTTMRVSRTRAPEQGLGQPPQRPHDKNEKQEPAGAKRRSRFCRLRGNARRRDHSDGRVVVRHNTGSFEICFWSRGKRSAPKKRSFAGFAPNAKRQRRSIRTGIVAPSPGRLPVLAFFLHDGERWGISGRETESSRKRSFPFPDVPPRFIAHRARSAPVPPNPQPGDFIPRLLPRFAPL